MSIESFVSVVSSLTELIKVLIWPAVIIWLVAKYGNKFQAFANDLSELTFKAAGVEATAKRKIAVAAALGAATAKANPDVDDGKYISNSAEEIEDLVSEKVTAKSYRRLHGARVLWVDDRPDNNIYERQSMEALGIDFDLALSTEEAIEKISLRNYSAVISDMGRPPDSRAGYTLLEKIKTNGIQIPYIIYAGSNLPEHKHEAHQRGAVGSTNRAIELTEMVITSILSK